MTFTLTTGNNANSILIIINPITVSHGIIIKLTLILIENTIEIITVISKNIAVGSNLLTYFKIVLFIKSVLLIL